MDNINVWSEESIHVTCGSLKCGMYFRRHDFACIHMEIEASSQAKHLAHFGFWPVMVR